VHAEHAEEEGVIARYRADPEQRGDHRDSRDLDDLPQHRGSSRNVDPAADVEERLLGPSERLSGPPDLPA